MKISIITVSHNSSTHIEQTIQSVIQQTYQNIEYIIIDGASTDGTLDIIKKHKDNLDYWISESDKGIADAMNKGLKVAKGNYILFLHSDDYLVDENVLEEAAQFLDQDHDLFLFNLYYSDNGNKALVVKPKGLDWWTNFKTGVLHQSVLCSRTLFEKIGNFDTNFKIAMDYDFFLRAYRAGAKSKHIDLPLSVMRKTGISSQTDWNNLKMRFAEERQVHNKNCNAILLKIIYQFYWVLYLPYRYILSCFKPKQ